MECLYSSQPELREAAVHSLLKRLHRYLESLLPPPPPPRPTVPPEFSRNRRAGPEFYKPPPPVMPVVVQPPPSLDPQYLFPALVRALGRAMLDKDVQVLLMSVHLWHAVLDTFVPQSAPRKNAGASPPPPVMGILTFDTFVSPFALHELPAAVVGSASQRPTHAEDVFLWKLLQNAVVTAVSGPTAVGRTEAARAILRMAYLPGIGVLGLFKVMSLLHTSRHRRAHLPYMFFGVLRLHYLC